MAPLTRLSLKNRLLVGLATLAVALLGVVSMGALKQELMPSMQVPMAFISAQSQGLAPEEMAGAVTEPLEQAVQSVPGVTSIASTTSSGTADVTVEWPFEEDDDETLQALRAAVDGLRPTLPDGTEVEVFSGGADGMPAMVLSAGAEGEDRAEAGSGDEEDAGSSGAPAFGDVLAQRVVPALQGVEGVQRVELAGREEQRIAIDLRPGDVERLQVDPARIAEVLESHGAATPAGQADSDDGPISVTVGAALSSLKEVAALPIPTEEGAVRISDFADVTSESVPAEQLSRVNGKPAMTLQVMPAQGANVVDVSHGVTAELDRLAPELRAEFVPVFDQAPYIEQSIHDLSVEGGLGLLFAVLVILAFLGSWRSTVIAAVSIPLSLLITLIGLWLSGNTLNILTLGALTIAIGRVVDDSIVVIENISRRRGSGPLTIESVVASVRQVAGAITASTLTTVAVFLPIAFVSGMAGQLFRPFAITVTIALLASLLVALTIVPVLAFWFMRNRSVRGGSGGADAIPAGADPAPAPALADNAAGAIEDSELHELSSPYDRLQRAIMPALGATRRHPVITLVVSGLVLVGTLAMSTLLQTDFLGSSGAESLRLTQTPPSAEEIAERDDSDAERAEASAEELGAVGGQAELVAAATPVEEALGEVAGVRDVLTTIPLRTAGSPAVIDYDLQLEDGADAERTGTAVERRLERLQHLGEFELMTQDAYVGEAGGGIALQIRGNDPAALREASELLEKRLGDAAGVRSVRSELAGEQPVLRVELDEGKAARLGFDRVQVAAAIRTALEGSAVGSLVLDGREQGIVVRTPGAGRSAERLADILLPVTPQQDARAQKKAVDELAEKTEAEAEQARIESNAELTDQLNEAAGQRSELVSQLGALNQQLEALLAAPVTPGEPRTPEEDARARAVEERAEQIEALRSAIAGAEGGITGLDEQMASLRQTQSDAAQQLAEQQEAEAEQKRAAEARGTALRLGDIAEVEQRLTAPTITREGGERQVVLTVTPEKGGLDRANAAVDEAIAETELPAGVSFELGGVGAEQDDAFAQLGIAMLAAILLVLLVMVATFRGFRGPLVLLISIPFAATGAILGLLLTNTPLGLPALIGLLMLIGIVVTNAIVLMDLIRRLRESGAPLDAAVEHGTRLRLRPILMTAAATIFALVPMSLGLTGGGVFISKPLAIVVIGGLISSTLLTLVLVPILYTLVERRAERRSAKRAERRERRAERRAARLAEREDARAAQRAARS